MSWGKAVCSAVISIFHISLPGHTGLRDNHSPQTLPGVLSYVEICGETEETPQN